MTIQAQIYDTSTLLGVYEEVAPVSSYWLDLCFQQVVVSDDEYIDFEKLVENRKLAPLVIPTAQGVPIYGRSSTQTRIKPAYLKPKDPVSPSRAIKKSAASGGVLKPNNGPKARFDAIVADIMRTHANAIDRRLEWMAANAIINGTVTLKGDSYPEQILNFNRDSNLTIVLGSGARWGDSGVSIMANLNDWRTRVNRAKFGGKTTRLTLGSDALAVFLKDPEVLKQLDTTLRGSQATLNTGLREGDEAEYIGQIGSLAIWCYSGYYEDENGSAVNYMSTKDVVLTGPNIRGIRAFGAILDVDANLQAIQVFPKMWKQQDPSALFIMTQSAPIMVPVNPNNSLKATVLA